MVSIGLCYSVMKIFLQCGSNWLKNFFLLPAEATAVLFSASSLSSFSVNTTSHKRQLDEILHEHVPRQPLEAY